MKKIYEEQWTLLDILFCFSRALTLTWMGFYKNPTSANIYCSILNFLQTFSSLPQLFSLRFLLLSDAEASRHVLIPAPPNLKVGL